MAAERLLFWVEQRFQRYLKSFVFGDGFSGVETETPIDVLAHGEFVCRTAIEIGIAPKALKLFVP